MRTILCKINRFLTVVAAGALLMHAQVCGNETDNEIEMLTLDIISYEDFVQAKPEAMRILDLALHEKGIVGIKGIPGYKEKLHNFIEHAREFSSLPEEIKELYAPNRDLGETFLGYERGKERFKRPDGTWVVDDLKVSYYAFVPDCSENKWPSEVDLKNPFQAMGTLMAEMGAAVMNTIGITGPQAEISSDRVQCLGRMLYYRKSSNSSADNPFWCGAHFDHGLFTALLPAFYFVAGEPVKEPAEAGLFVRQDANSNYRKVAADDMDVMMFQVGEFGQLISNDGIRATEHRVRKAEGCVERYTMALFFNAPPEVEINSTSVLTADARYGGSAGDPCTYRRWDEESFKRYLFKEEDQK